MGFTRLKSVMPYKRVLLGGDLVSNSENYSYEVPHGRAWWYKVV